MIIPPNTMIKIAPFNFERCYLMVQNMNSNATDLVYLRQDEEYPEVFVNSGIAIGGYGIFEMQHCVNPKSKQCWYAYTEVAGGVDLRVMDI